MSNKPLVTISVLCSKNYDGIKRCLDSIQPILKEVSSELILTDTSKDAKVRALLEEYTDKIYSFTWVNDFAKARNLALEIAQGTWFMFIDDDEWFDDPKPIIDFFNSGEHKKYGNAMYQIRNYSAVDGSAWADMWANRLTKLIPGARFQGRIHETIAPVSGAYKQIPCFAHHYGYAFSNEEEKKAHALRNIPLLKAMMKEEPENMRWPIHLMKEYNILEDGQAMRELAVDSMEILEDKTNYADHLDRGIFYTSILMGDIKLGLDLQEDFELLFSDPRNPAIVQCSLLKNAALNAQLKGRPEAAKEYCRMYFECLNEVKKEGRDKQELLLESIATFLYEDVGTRIQNFVTMLSNM